MKQKSEHTERDTKRTYVKPRLTVEGDWKDITAGSVSTPSGHIIP